MKVNNVLLLRGKPNSGKSTVLKTVINELGGWKKCARLFLCKGACLTRSIAAPMFGCGDVTGVFEINGHIVVIVTFGDAPYDAEKVQRMLAKVSAKLGKDIDLLGAALRQTRNGALEASYRRLFAPPTIFEKNRTPGQTSVNPNKLNASDKKSVKDVCDVIKAMTK